MRHDKIKAAKRLVDGLTSELDFDFFLDSHPNTESVLRRLSTDINRGTNYMPKEKYTGTITLDGESMPWCEPCQSWHMKPRDKEHHAALQCRAMWPQPITRAELIAKLQTTGSPDDKMFMEAYDPATEEFHVWPVTTVELEDTGMLYIK